MSTDSPKARHDCPECRRLEREYESSAHQITLLLSKRCDTIALRLRELRKLQDLRDDALEEFYRHKRSHAVATSSVS
jgi:hypothetical protein